MVLPINAGGIHFLEISISCISRTILHAAVKYLPTFKQASNKLQIDTATLTISVVEQDQKEKGLTRSPTGASEMQLSAF